MALGSSGGGVVTLLGGCRVRLIVQAKPSGAAMTASKITGMITASTYAALWGRCNGGRCGMAGRGGGAARNGCDSWGGAHLGSTLDMRQGSEIAVQVPGDEGGGNSARLSCHVISHFARVVPTAFQQRTQ